MGKLSGGPGTGVRPVAVHTVHTVRKLRDATRPGDRFQVRVWRFSLDTMDGRYEWSMAGRYEWSTETVAQIFPHIARMRSGRTYTWTELLVWGRRIGRER